jgi:hypothetical protein
MFSLEKKLNIFKSFKGQLISKYIFGVFNFFPKMNENKSA